MFDEYFKAQSAAARGVRRANPNAIIIPTCGTSGYSRMRGYDAIEGYLNAARKHGFRYDAIAVHPYGNIDKGTLSQNDLDEETRASDRPDEKVRLRQRDPDLFHGNVQHPGNLCSPHGEPIPPTITIRRGKPSYDFGNREFIHASSAARIYIMALKYWPQVQSVNIWVAQPFMDLSLTPILLCKAVNTLGTHLGDVAYLADVKPAAGIRGYVFRHKKRLWHCPALVRESRCGKRTCAGTAGAGEVRAEGDLFRSDGQSAFCEDGSERNDGDPSDARSASDSGGGSQPACRSAAECGNG